MCADERRFHLSHTPMVRDWNRSIDVSLISIVFIINSSLYTFHKSSTSGSANIYFKNKTTFKQTLSKMFALCEGLWEKLNICKWYRRETKERRMTMGWGLKGCWGERHVETMKTSHVTTNKRILKIHLKFFMRLNFLQHVVGFYVNCQEKWQSLSINFVKYFGNFLIFQYYVQ